ncbi:MAG: GGDEF domain-containing protein [Planctomycetota bacterium]
MITGQSGTNPMQTESFQVTPHRIDAPVDRLQPALARNVRRVMANATVLIGILAGITVYIILHQRDIRAALDRAQLISAAVTTFHETTLSEQMRTLQVSSPDTTAIGLVDPSGAIVQLRPDWPELRKTVIEAAKVRGHATALTTTVDGRSLSVFGVVIPPAKAGGGFTTVVLLHREFPWFSWCLAVSAILAATCLVIRLTTLRITRWFESEVVEPIHRLIAALGDKEGSGSGTTRARNRCVDLIPSPYAEFQELLKAVTEHEGRVGRIEREAQWRIREHENGLERKLRRAEDRATTDPLTGLRNRAFMDKELSVIVEHQRETGAELAAVMLDIDNFKPHNDTHGHHAGDELLRFVGELIRGTIRPTDHAVRYGGDEFLLILPHAGPSQAKIVVERIVKLFGQYAATKRGKMPVSLSAGIASLQTTSSQDTTCLVKEADAALYAAKRAGKNAVATAST